MFLIRPVYRLILIAILPLGIAACSHPTTSSPARQLVVPHVVNGLKVPARAGVGQIELATAGGFNPTFFPGVNLGATVPGHSPGEVALDRATIRRWLVGMGDLGARVVRIYTILPPRFYDELASYNELHPAQPLMLIQGVWLPEEEFIAAQDLYAAPVTNGFRSEIGNAVAGVHGDAVIPARPGHASGTYRTDISKWLLGWSIGIEWDPTATLATDTKHAGTKPFHGRYIVADRSASPSESWLASMMDETASLEARRGWSRPLAFTNWLTTDPLSHPSEPSKTEDMVTVDPTHVHATKAWPGGVFASYHVYPYYPDFLRWQKSYQQYRRPRDGKLDPYSGYLKELRAYEGDQPVMVTEFGLPTSIGMAHKGPAGRNQGGHSEKESLAGVGDMMTSIRDEGYAGGLVFEWADEWYKFTWNTVDYELPAAHRSMWKNPLTNEANFGLLDTTPGIRTPVVVVDGKDAEWSSVPVAATTSGAIAQIKATHDAEYLYLLIKFAGDTPTPVTLGVDAAAWNGGGLPGTSGVDTAAESAIVIDGTGAGRAMVAAGFDPLVTQYGPPLGFVPFRAADLKDGSGVWDRRTLILNRPYVVPGTPPHRNPVEMFDASNIRKGTADSSVHGFDSRTLASKQGRTLELRLPWAFLGMSDPSSKQVLVPDGRGGFVSRTTSMLKLSAVVAGSDVASFSYPWSPWNIVTWHDRRKAGFDQLARVVHALRAEPPAQRQPSGVPGASPLSTSAWRS